MSIIEDRKGRGRGEKRGKKGRFPKLSGNWTAPSYTFCSFAYGQPEFVQSAHARTAGDTSPISWVGESETCDSFPWEKTVKRCQSKDNVLGGKKRLQSNCYSHVQRCKGKFLEWLKKWNTLTKNYKAQKQIRHYRSKAYRIGKVQS